jgi:P-type conjugative transfer protein TrbG
MKRLTVFLALAFATNAWAQSPEKAPPLVVKRSAAPKVNSSDVALQNKIESDLKALRQDPPTSPETAAPPLAPVGPLDRAPAGYQPPSDLPLSPTAEAAVRVSEKWLTETVTPAPGADGRVLYSYGAGLATVVCAPLRLCVVELQLGERLISEPHIGDSVRWHIAPALFGKGDSSTTVLIVKPQEPGLDTNLVITTDRRIYYLRLVSKPEDYTAHVAFAYPDDDVADQRWKEHLAKQEEEKRETGRIAHLAPDAVESMNFDYQLKGDERIRPVQVFDDGSKTYIRMNPNATSREAPVLVVIGEGGKPEMLNYRVKGDMYIADRLFDRAQLVLGAGKTSLKSEIVRGTKKKKS